MLNRKGFILIEVIAAVVIVSVGLVLIAQALVTNLRVGNDFQKYVRLILAAENQLVFNLSVPQVSSSEKRLTEPYKDLMCKKERVPLDGSLARLDILISQTGIKKKSTFQITTMAYEIKE